jgi:predicted lipid-binding transport protein (Tim44 family)
MMKLTRTFFLAATMLAVPAFTVMAQPSASPGTSNNRAVTQPSNTGDRGAYSTTRPTPGNMAATNPHTPGATGRTIVPGDSSTMAGTAPEAGHEATPGRSGGGNR